MGIRDLQQKAEERKNRVTTQTRELWLQDDDEARLTILTLEKEENGRYVDPYFNSFYIRREAVVNDNGKRFNKKYFLAENREDIPQEYLKERGVVAEQIAFWCYVYYILHASNVVKGETKDWKRVERGGVTRYREEVNDFKIYIGGLGNKRSFEGDLNSINMEVGALDKNVVKLIKEKNGSEPTDVVYKIRETPEKSEIPEEKRAEIKDLPNVIDYAKEHLVEYVKNSTPKTSDNSSSSEEEDTGLF